MNIRVCCRQLFAVIGKDGAIQEVQLISGHPLLSKAALDAVRQWRYKPFLLDGQPIDVQTTVEVHFSLSPYPL
jgi:protein TonB